MRGELDSHATCLEQKAGEKAVSVLAEEGHLGVELVAQKRWTAGDGTLREIDAMVTANECVLCVEVKLKAGLASVAQLLATLVFLRYGPDTFTMHLFDGWFLSSQLSRAAAVSH